MSKAEVGASNCKIACDSLTACDAYDVSTANGWCGLWGMQLVLDANNNKIADFVRSDSGGNKVIGGNRFYGAAFYTDNNCYMKIKSGIKTATHEFIATTSSMTLSFFTNETNCIDISNVVVQDISTNLGSGGGLFAESLEIDDVGVKIRMTTTTFKNNQAKVGSGGGMFAKGSGVAINMYGGQNKFTDNQAHANCVSAVGGISLQPDHPCSNIDGLWQGGYKIPQYRYFDGTIFQKIRRFKN